MSVFSMVMWNILICNRQYNKWKLAHKEKLKKFKIQKIEFQEKENDLNKK